MLALNPSVPIQKAFNPRLSPQRNHRRTVASLRYGGFYSHDDVREVVRYAEQRGITVVPEIDVPGHCYAALQALPELAKTVEKRKAPRSVQGPVVVLLKGVWRCLYDGPFPVF